MPRIHFRLSLGLLCILSLPLACADDAVGTASGVVAETGATETGPTGSSDAGESNDGQDGDGDPAGDGDGDPTGVGDGDGDGDPSTTGDGDGDGDASTTGDGDGDGDGDAPYRGDGTIDPGEQCDDGPDMGVGFACLGDCTLNVCGDGSIGPNEGCDDGNLLDNDGCSANCTLEDVLPQAILCGNKLFECGDTFDNDMDGLVDLADPECTSPCDDDEGSFKTNLPGQNNDCKGDCYFDNNSGGGDDKCEWNLKCDPENPGAQIGCEYDPDFEMCGLEMPQDCLDFCVPLVPNGCDCFGCCEIAGQFVYLDGAECALDDLEACESCTFFEGCNNPCEPENCELCIGQNPNDLPPECSEPTCPNNLASCFDEGDCEPGEFCQTGCCVPVTPQ